MSESSRSAEIHSHGHGDNSANDSTAATKLVAAAKDSAQSHRLTNAASSFQSSVKCYDVAVIDENRLVLATGNNGMKEYDLPAGKELGGWRPPKTATGKNEWIYAIDALADERVAVALDESKCVAILRRSDSPDQPWLEDKRIGLKQSPYHVAAHGSTLAVTTDGAAVAQVWVPGMAGAYTLDPSSTLCLMSANASDDEQPLLELKLDYKAFNVALSADSVVVLSLEKQMTKGDARNFVADAFNYRGSLMWRYACADQMNDICPEPGGSVLYAALRGAKRISAISSSDGRFFEDALSAASHETPVEPIALSMGKIGGHSFAVVLFADWRTITLYFVGSKPAP